MEKLIECVPNFSEGRDLNVIKQITDEIESVEGVKLLNVDPGKATNRTVVTFVGGPEAVIEAAFRGIKKAGELIDMSRHKGEHPRMGATDVCPLIPIAGISMEETAQYAQKLAKRVGEELKIPVYLYEAAQKDYEFLQNLIHPIVGREILSTMLGEMDLTPYSLDEPLPDPLPPSNGSRGHYDSIVAMARRENLTIRELGNRVAGARGKNVFVGTPAEVADYMEEWFSKEACDGFTIMPPYIPGSHDDFCELVVPELQRRGLFRTEYEGTTLRDNLGLPRPDSVYARPGRKKAGTAG